MPQMLWTRYFIEAQGFTIDKMYCSRTTLALCYLRGMVWCPAVSRKTHKGKVLLYQGSHFHGGHSGKNVPTGEMLADNFTKIVQGALFQKTRAEIKGITATMTDEEMCWYTTMPFNMAPVTTKTATRKPITQECVGEEQSYDPHMNTSRITGYKKGLDNTFCRGTKSCAGYNDSCRGKKSCARHIGFCRGTKSRAEHN